MAFMSMSKMLFWHSGEIFQSKLCIKKIKSIDISETAEQN